MGREPPTRRARPNFAADAEGVKASPMPTPEELQRGRRVVPAANPNAPGRASSHWEGMEEELGGKMAPKARPPPAKYGARSMWDHFDRFQESEKEVFAMETEDLVAHTHASGTAGMGTPIRHSGVTRRPYEDIADGPVRIKREELLNRAGGNPYDSYHGGRSPEAVNERSKKGADGQSEQMKSFLQHMKMASGAITPIAPALRFNLDNPYAQGGMPVMPGVSEEPGLTHLQRALSDFDWGDRRATGHVAHLYPWAPTIIAALVMGTTYLLYHLQLQYHAIDYYDDFLGLDVRKYQPAEGAFVFVVAGVFVRFLVWHPTLLAVIVGTRILRMKRGLPIGPP